LTDTKNVLQVACSQSEKETVMHAGERMTEDQVAETLVSLAMARAETALRTAESPQRPARLVGTECQGDDGGLPESPAARPTAGGGRGQD
jgi:hypothetical protein